MKTKLLTLIAGLACSAFFLFTGCSSVPKIIAAMAKDPATVSIRVSSIYGTIQIYRWTTNAAPVQQ